MSDIEVKVADGPENVLTFLVDNRVVLQARQDGYQLRTLYVDHTLMPRWEAISWFPSEAAVEGHIKRLYQDPLVERE